MNWKRVWLVALLVFIVMQITDFLINSVILSGVYAAPGVKEAFRDISVIMGYYWVMLITGAVFSFFFALIFAKGYESRGLMEGIRYGFYIGMMFVFVMAFNQFAVYNIPYSLVWYWIILGIIQTIILGIVAALVYKTKSAPAAAAAA